MTANKHQGVVCSTAVQAKDVCVAENDILKISSGCQFTSCNTTSCTNPGPMCGAP